MSQPNRPGLAAWRVIRAEPELWDGLLALASEEIRLAREQSRTALYAQQYNTALQLEAEAVGIEKFLATVQAEANDYSPPKTSA